MKVFFKDVFAKHGKTLDALGVNVNNGFANLLDALKKLPEAERAIEADIQAAYAAGPEVAMVNFGKGYHQPARTE